MKGLIRNLFLYGIIGCIAAGCDAAVFFVLTQSIQLNPLIANLISVPLGICISFALNRKYNFKVEDHAIRRGMIFFGVGLFGLLVSQTILYAGSLINMHAMTAKLISIIVVALIQFTLNKLISFGITFTGAKNGPHLEE